MIPVTGSGAALALLPSAKVPVAAALEGSAGSPRLTGSAADRSVTSSMTTATTAANTRSR
ncbi:MAG: hypothetical protein KF782_23060 [Labilithrix sp.]|nr:hypothetical protein [Labilithrix sp.]